MKDQKIYQFIEQKYGEKSANSLKVLTQSGSARIYYRFDFEQKNKIVCYNHSVEENETFFYFSEVLHKINPESVPTVEHISSNRKMYVQKDLGNETLMDLLLNQDKNIEDYYRKVIVKLIESQLDVDQIIDYSKCFSYQNFNQVLVLRDLYQFQFFFLDALEINYVPNQLLSDFERFANVFSTLKPKGFVFRDFQSRNIMIHQNNPYFIDYQGGLKGPVMYDLVSLIWQAKADFSLAQRTEFLHFYIRQIKLYQPKFTNEDLYESYHYCVAIRVLQTLGAYGLRGLIEGKKHFKESIIFGLKNLQEVKDFDLMENYPALGKVIKEILSLDTKEKIEKKLDGK